MITESAIGSKWYTLCCCERVIASLSLYISLQNSSVLQSLALFWHSAPTTIRFNFMYKRRYSSIFPSFPSVYIFDAQLPHEPLDFPGFLRPLKPPVEKDISCCPINREEPCRLEPETMIMLCVEKQESGLARDLAARF